MPDENENPNTPTADELRESIRAELKAELGAQHATINELIANELASAPEHVKKLIPEALAPIEQVR